MSPVTNASSPAEVKINGGFRKTISRDIFSRNDLFRRDAFQGDPSWVRFAVFIGPLATFALVGYLVPRMYLGVDADVVTADEVPLLTLWVTAARLLMMALVVGFAAKRLLRSFPLRVSGLAIIVGLIGGGVWIGLCRLNLEAAIVSMLGLSEDFLGSRDAIDPWSLYEAKWSLNTFLASRFLLLIVAVPIAEELMLRGFLIRTVETDDWHALPLDHVGRLGIIAATVYGILSHPSECIAAAVWFSMVTWLMLRTNKFWDCVVAHAITNGLLGLYIIYSGDWRLW